MPSVRKQSDKTPSEKLIALYSMLLFAHRGLSLGTIASQLECSKQSVLRLIERIETSGYGQIIREKAGRETCYRLAKPRNLPRISLNAAGLHELMLCRNFLRHMLPEQTKHHIDAVLQEASAYLSSEELTENISEDFLSIGDACTKGRIDLSPYQAILDTMIAAIRRHRVVNIVYNPATRNVDTAYCFVPHRITAFHDSIYIIGRQVTAEGVARPINDHNNTFVLHRFKSATLTTRHADLVPELRAAGEGAFGMLDTGVIFTAKIRFAPEVAGYVAARVWSEQQEITTESDGSLLLTMAVRSRNELISWLLSFRNQAELLEPADVREEIARVIADLAATYRA